MSGVDGALVRVVTGATCDFTATDLAGAVVATGQTGAGDLDMSAVSAAHGVLTVVLSRSGVPSPVGIGRVVTDSDGDGIPDVVDPSNDQSAAPLGARLALPDSNGDGVPDYQAPGLPLFGVLRLGDGSLAGIRCYYDADVASVSCETDPGGALVLYPPVCSP